MPNGHYLTPETAAELRRYLQKTRDLENKTSRSPDLRNPFDHHYSWGYVWNEDPNFSADAFCVVALDKPACTKGVGADHLLHNDDFLVREATRVDCGKLAVLFKPLGPGCPIQPSQSCAIYSGMATAQVRFPATLYNSDYYSNCQVDVDVADPCLPFSFPIDDIVVDAVTPTDSANVDISILGDCFLALVTGNVANTTGQTQITATTTDGNQAQQTLSSGETEFCLQLPISTNDTTVTVEVNAFGEPAVVTDIVVTNTPPDPDADPCKFTISNSGPVTLIWPTLDDIRDPSWQWEHPPTVCVDKDGCAKPSCDVNERPTHYWETPPATVCVQSNGAIRPCQPGECPTHYVDSQGRPQPAILKTSLCCVAKVRMQGDCRTGSSGPQLQTCEVLQDLQFAKDGCTVECRTETVYCPSPTTTEPDCDSSEITIEDFSILRTASGNTVVTRSESGTEMVEGDNPCECWEAIGEIAITSGTSLIEITVNGTTEQITAEGEFGFEFTLSGNEIDWQISTIGQGSGNVDFSNVRFAPVVGEAGFTECLNFRRCDVIQEFRSDPKNPNAIQCRKKSVLTCVDSAEDTTCAGIKITADDVSLSAAGSGSTDIDSVSQPCVGDCPNWSVTATATIVGEGTLVAQSGTEIQTLTESGPINLCATKTSGTLSLDLRLNNTGQSSVTATVTDICFEPTIEETDWETCFTTSGGDNSDCCDDLQDQIDDLKKCVCALLEIIRDNHTLTPEQETAIECCECDEPVEPTDCLCDDEPLPSVINVRIASPNTPFDGGGPLNNIRFFGVAPLGGEVEFIPDDLAALGAAYATAISSLSLEYIGGCSWEAKVTIPATGVLTASAAPGCQPNWPLDASVNICHVARIDMVADELDFYFQPQVSIVVTALDTSDPCPPECDGLAFDCAHPDRTGENGFINHAWGTFGGGGNPLVPPAIEALGYPCSGGTSPSLLNFASGNPGLPWSTSGITVSPG